MTRMFRAGGQPSGAGIAPQAELTGTRTLLADVSEFQSSIADAQYLAWSRAIVIRAMYGAAHDDRAWYGGQRRDLLHAGGARFVGVYAYLVAGQPGARQARAFHSLVGAIRPGEVFIADFEEGSRTVLEDWRAEMLALYGQAIRPYLWTYTGLYFGEAQSVLPVEWIAAYGQSEPGTPHKLWQFTDSYQVPGVGTCDASVFHGSIDQLAALAYPATAPKPPPPPPVPSPNPQWPAGLVLREGDTGDAVRALQQALHGSGFRGVRGITVDGIFGGQTLQAVEEFQMLQRIGIDGIAGPLTRAALVGLGLLTAAGVPA